MIAANEIRFCAVTS